MRKRPVDGEGNGEVASSPSSADSHSGSPQSRPSKILRGLRAPLDVSGGSPRGQLSGGSTSGPAPIKDAGELGVALAAGCLPTDIDLWTCDDESVWAAYLAAYPLHLAARVDSPRLVELDAWMANVLPRRIAMREPQPWFSREELGHIVTWKMMRGTWRPRNKALTLSNDELAVLDATVKGCFALKRVADSSKKVLYEYEYSCADDDSTLAAIKQAINSVAALSGIGPASASAVLSVYAPDLVPFLDSPMAKAITSPPLGPIKFTTKYYLAFVKRVRTKARVLEAARVAAGAKAADGGKTFWTANAVSQALWVYAAASGLLHPNSRVPRAELKDSSPLPGLDCTTASSSAPAAAGPSQ